MRRGRGPRQNLPRVLAPLFGEEGSYQIDQITGTAPSPEHMGPRFSVRAGVLVGQDPASPGGAILFACQNCHLHCISELQIGWLMISSNPSPQTHKDALSTVSKGQNSRQPLYHTKLVACVSGIPRYKWKCPDIARITYLPRYKDSRIYPTGGGDMMD
jgi:hypothetical protein